MRDKFVDDVLHCTVMTAQQQQQQQQQQHSCNFNQRLLSITHQYSITKHTGTCRQSFSRWTDVARTSAKLSLHYSMINNINYAVKYTSLFGLRPLSLYSPRMASIQWAQARTCSDVAANFAAWPRQSPQHCIVGGAFMQNGWTDFVF